MIYQPANKSDCTIHDTYRELNSKNGLKPKKIFADGNYISAKELKEYTKWNQKLMGRIPEDTTQKLKKFQVQSFKIDLNKKRAICPAGRKCISFNKMKCGDYSAMFSRKDCSQCKYTSDCLGGNTKSRSIRIHQFYEIIKKRRKEQLGKIFRKEMKVRAQIEGTISELVRKNGLRFAKYHGESGHQFQFYQAGAALNLKRYIKVLTKGIEIKKTA